MKLKDLQAIEGELRMTRPRKYEKPQTIRILDATGGWERARYNSEPRPSFSYEAHGVLVSMLVEHQYGLKAGTQEWVKVVLPPAKIVDETPEAYEARMVTERAEKAKETERRLQRQEAHEATCERITARLWAITGDKRYVGQGTSPSITWATLERLLDLAEGAL